MQNSAIMSKDEKDAEKEKDEAAILAQVKIAAPLQWDSSPDFIIQDLKEAHYEEVIHLIKHHFFLEEPMCKASFLLLDPVSVECYIELIRVWMKDTTSLVALSSRSGRVAGCAVTRINYLLDRTNTYSRVQLIEGAALSDIMQLKSALVKQAQVYEEFGIEQHMRIYILCVHPSYQKKGLGHSLLEATVRVARTLKISAVLGMFTSGVSQAMAMNLGMRILSEIRYSRWIVDDDVVFDDPGIGNYSAAFMGMLVPEEGPEEEKRRKRMNERMKKKKAKDLERARAKRKMS